MPYITIEYIIMVPLLVLQIFLFPMAANWMMNIWVDSRRELALETVAGRLASSIQQLYFSLNHESVLAGTITYNPGVPKYIDGYYYTARGQLTPLSGGESNQRLNITLTLVGLNMEVETHVTVGPNVDWAESSVFISNSTNACILVTKFANGSFLFSFGG